ncbi:hypothetical protein MtrunA17_Chr3g0098231 [Medicago truncatula]|uniref:Uncharacterized protein n=1 Tax=Medicago truncatula TaxID=3880 RepID=A0A396IN22_MEDTR|nr:hypothetical protein MtrunA17_Chr3g0098231 [Medicago truncatula]
MTFLKAAETLKIPASMTFLKAAETLKISTTFLKATKNPGQYDLLKGC